jgi:hypothetical protein
MDEFDVKEMLRQLGSMMQGANSAELVQKIVDFYDSVATTAYERLMDEVNGFSPEETARRAWEYADAMMAERVKRGLGSPPPKEA